MEEQRLRICEYNVENLFISMEYYEGQDLERLSEPEWKSLALAQLQRRQKPLAKTWGVAQAILDIDADIFMLIEVGGQDSLENFNRHFLGGRYVPYFIEGNSTRAIDLGFLVRKDLRFRVEALSNKDLPIEVYSYQGKYTSKFSRDVAELRIFDGDRLRFILLLVHLKSMISTDQDYKGKDVRTAEAIALASLYSKLRGEFPDVPIVVGGDFNTNLGSLELELIQRTDLMDFHRCLGTPECDRVSLVHFDFSGAAHPQTLDYLLVSPHLRDRILPEESFTYRYKSFHDVTDDLPQTPRERYQMPSDHYPLVLTVRLE